MGFDDDAENVIEAGACVGIQACFRIGEEGPASIQIRAGACGKKLICKSLCFRMYGTLFGG